jgi:hypothetical protein
VTTPARATYPELPIDVVDATGLLGALAGVLSMALPFFLGLTIALSALLVSAGLLRRAGDPARARSAGPIRRRYWWGFGASAMAWTFLLAHPTADGPFVGAVLGIAGLPLWSVARRPLPFGGG